MVTKLLAAVAITTAAFIVVVLVFSIVRAFIAGFKYGWNTDVVEPSQSPGRDKYPRAEGEQPSSSAFARSGPVSSAQHDAQPARNHVPRAT